MKNLVLLVVLAGVISMAGSVRAFGADAQVGGFTDAEALLDALETADRDIETFQARITYDRIFALQGDRHIRGGDLYYRVEDVSGRARPLRTFAVHFDWLLLGDELREERQAWMFDGVWLVEKRFGDKQYVARQIARPGEEIDPLRLGEGPLPLPIGQRKEDILARYEAELLPAEAGFDTESEIHGPYMGAVAGREGEAPAVQLHLTPLSHRAETDDFQSIRLWYREDAGGRLLPVLSRTVDRKGDESFMLLANVRVNEPLPEGVVDISPPEEGTGWDVQYERLRAEGEAEQAEAGGAE